MPFEFKVLEIKDVMLITPEVYQDERGFFKETFKDSDFSKMGISIEFLQDSISRSSKNIIRGLHYQKNPKAQAKLVSCVKGTIFDVAVDIRKNSPTYGKWVGAELSEENHQALFIPRGFAHGFVALSDIADVSYKLSEEHSEKDEAGIIYNDPDICIQWPVENPILSKRDRSNPTLKQADNNFEF